MIDSEHSFRVELGDAAVTTVRRVGHGPRVLFSHGSGFSCDAFASFVHELARTFEVLCFDHRGHGLGPAVDVETFSLPLLTSDTTDVAQAIRHRHDGEPLFGVFHSIAGICALRAQLDHCGLFDAIVGYEPPLAAIGSGEAAFRDGAAEMAFRARNRKRHFESAQDLAQRYIRSKVLIGATDEAALVLANGVLEDSEDGRMRLRCDPEIEAKVYATNTDFGLWQDLGKIDCPGMIMSGDLGERATYTEMVAPEVARLADFRLHRVDGLSHLGWIESPVATASAVSDFLKAI